QQSLAPLVEYKHKIFVRSLIVGFLLLLISGVILYGFITYQIQRRLDGLSHKAKRIGAGDIEPDLEIGGNDELSDLAATMNDMCNRLLTAREKISTGHKARIKTLEQLRHTERLSTLGHMSAGIAHEMGTPLNIVSGRAKMIAAGTLPLQEMIESAVIIKNQSDRMTKIIRQFLDFTRRRKPKYASTNVLSLIKQVFEILSPIAKKQGVVLELTKPEKMTMPLRMDANQIQQVMINLIMNSIQAMPDGGKVGLEMFNKKMCDPNTDNEKHYLAIKFSDNGDGIAGEKLGHIFEPFFTTKKVGEGTGLGLSIVQGIIEEHNGWIDVESEKAKGSTFIIYLPMGKAQ
ncbi:MAG: HAMP domain-containing histidine kinase, partial [Deltaproteobacteria bacterium]|nr:HAMP domain-containing histidine kinase [Deltaproteobacteria bacterium]